MYMCMYNYIVVYTTYPYIYIYIYLVVHIYISMYAHVLVYIDIEACTKTMILACSSTLRSGQESHTTLRPGGQESHARRSTRRSK